MSFGVERYGFLWKAWTIRPGCREPLTTRTNHAARIPPRYEAPHPEGLQKGPLFQYLHRKDDRRRFKAEVLRLCCEQIYPFDDPGILAEKVAQRGACGGL